MTAPNPLDHPICLAPPMRVAPSGWLEHVPFGMYLVSVLRPRTIVELGTHNGVSYCAFCQAVRELQIDARCYAVDNWRGDPQAGFYGPEVLEDLRAHHDPLYSNFSALVRSSFDDAVDRFEDGSIDLLHIDGYHTYEASKHDFERWLPKMGERGVVLLHDVGVREKDFGVWRLWEEIRSAYQTFEFTHGHGLGVAAVGGAQPDTLRALVQAGETDAQRIRELFHQLGLRVSQHAELQSRKAELEAHAAEIRRLTDTYDRTQETIQELRASLEGADAAKAKVLELESRLHELEAPAAELEVRAFEAERRSAMLASRLAERDATVRDLSDRLATWEDHWTRTQQTASWRVVMRLREMRKRVAPDESRRARLWRRVRRRSADAVPTSRPRAQSAAPLSNASDLDAVDSRPETTPESDSNLSWAVATVGGDAVDIMIRNRLRSFLQAGSRLRFPRCPDPRVSIVVPVLNQAHLTLAMLESLLADTGSIAFEVLVVDNGSSDETAMLAERVENVRFHHNETNLGFGEACNIGARLSRAPYLCFLNNDTLPNPGWLSELLEIAERYPACGAVGARLVLPTGQLQEAGSIIWRDGSALGYGRGDTPFEPEYSYVREVDFCSANGLLVRSDIFRQVGGFDSRYAPAYYEDADLCLSIWAAGYRVAYAPKATITHLEHATSTRAEAVRLQLRNRERFCEKWKGTLDTRLMPGKGAELRARDRRTGRRVLVLDDRVPESRMGSGFPRTRSLLEALAHAGYVVTYLPTTDPRRVDPEASELEAMGIEVLCGGEPARRIRSRPNLYDVVLVSRPHNAPLIEVARESNPGSAVVYDAEAIFSLRDARRAQVQGKPLPQAEIDTRIKAELEPVRSADLIVTVTEQERQAVQRYFSEADTVVWGHSVEVVDCVPPFSDRVDLLFVGYLASDPNLDAMVHFITDVMPHVRNAIDCRLRVVGADPPGELLAAAARLHDAVVFEGYQEDLTRLYDRARIFVAPHRYAAGLPLKVVEAMAHGVPCVVSGTLAEQLGITGGVEALVADGAGALAHEVGGLYQDPGLWNRIQHGAYRYVREHFEAGAMRAALTDHVERAVSAKQSAVGEASTGGRDVRAVG